MNIKQKIWKIMFCSFFISFVLIDFVYSQTDIFGEKLMKMNQLKTAKIYFLNKLSNKVNDISSIFYLGEVYYNIGNTDTAELYFQKGIIHNPNDIYCNIGIGKIQLDKSNFFEAKKIFDKVSTLTKNKDVRVFITIANALINSKNKHFELALEYLQKAKDVDKTKPDIYIISGDMYSIQINFGEAANEYERAIYYDKNCVEAYYKLGKIYSVAKNYNESLKAFESALKIDSTYIPVWRDLAELYYSKGYYQKASDAFYRYIQLTEPELNDNIRYATILFFNKEYSKSLAEADNALQKDSTNFVMKRLKAYNLFETKDFTKGLAVMKDYFKTTSENKIIPTDYEYFGKILSKNNLDSIAIIAFGKSMKLDTNKKNLYENIGLSYDKLKKFNKSVSAYENLILSKDKSISSEYFLLGRSAYFFGGLLVNSIDSLNKIFYLQKADTSFSKVIELSPNSYLGYFWKARVKALLDPETDSGYAKPWYEKVVAILENATNNKKELIESYQYLGYYYYLKKEKETSLLFWKKILEIDPNDKKAIEAINGMK